MNIEKTTFVQVRLGTLIGDVMHDALIDALEIARERGINAKLHAHEAYNGFGMMDPNGFGAPRLTVTSDSVTAYDLVNEARDRAIRSRFWTRCAWDDGLADASHVASMITNCYTAMECGREDGNVNLGGYGPVCPSVLNWEA